jgi:hypothetical protein
VPARGGRFAAAQPRETRLSGVLDATERGAPVAGGRVRFAVRR